MNTSFLIDRFNRRHDYLRISVTDRCNLRCTYCMGPQGVPLLEREAILDYESIVKVVRAAAELGIHRIRLTGGEPLVRQDLSWLVRKLREIPGIDDLSLTTNGILLADYAKELRAAGLDRVNISLDTIDPKRFREITRGGDIERVFAGIRAALDAGLNPVKLNFVVMKNINDGDIPDMLRWAVEFPVHLRFIEYMPMGQDDTDQREQFLSNEAIKERIIQAGFRLHPEILETGGGPAELYRLENGAGCIGFISPVSRHFCAGCNRLRLTIDGFLKPCLYWPDELSVRPALDQPEKLRELFIQALSIKPEEHRMGTRERACRRSMSRIGG